MILVRIVIRVYLGGGDLGPRGGGQLQEKSLVFGRKTPNFYQFSNFGLI